MKWLKVILLFPFGILWWTITFLRRMLYQWGIKKRYTSSIETICIGNLKVGGTGKTPHVLAFAKIYADRKLAILSRGYGRKTKGLLEIDKPEADKYGDEPSMLKQKMPAVPMVVSESRVLGLQYIEENFPEVDLVLMDDAYQHLAVKCSKYVLLTEFDFPYFKDWVLPMGWLRESRFFARQANQIIVTKCPKSITEKTKKYYRKKIGIHQEVHFSSMEYAQKLYTIEGESLDWDELPKQQHLLVTGIANPNPLLIYLNQQKVNIKHHKFPDHHSFTSTEIAEIEKYLSQNPTSLLITTEKDAVRLSKFPSLVKRMYLVSIKVKFRDSE